MPTPRHPEPAPRGHPIHDSIFGDDVFDDDAPEIEYDDTPPGASRAAVNLGATAIQPERFDPMRNLGDTDQGDRQPDASRRR